MTKLYNNAIVFKEVPNEISLAINITNCPLHCKGCHSPWLQEDIGEELTEEVLLNLIKSNVGISCVLFLGGDNSYEDIKKLAKIVKNTGLKCAWYSGKTLIHTDDLQYFDYIKTGPYIESKGGLESPNTNQRFFKVMREERNNQYFYSLQDQSYLFQKN